jgi:hypothetical protein
VALVVSIHFLRPRNPTAAEEGAPKKE